MHACPGPCDGVDRTGMASNTFQNPLWIFAGQGARRPGDVTGLSAARSLFERIAAVTGLHTEGADTDGNDCNKYSGVVQPALLAIAHACALACKARGGEPGGVLGHSFGEYAALVTAGALSFDDALRIAALRGQAMAELSDGSSSMLAVTGLSASLAERISRDLRASGRFVFVAAYNSPSQTVLAGERVALSSAAQRCRSVGARDARFLQIPFAAHSPLMQPARERMASELSKVWIGSPTIPFYSSVTGKLTKNSEDIRELLVRAVTEPVDFRQAIISALQCGYGEIVEIGSARPPKLLGLVAETCSKDLPERALPRLACVSADADAPDGRPFTPRLAGAGRRQ